MDRRPLPSGKQDLTWQGQGHAGLWYEKLGGTWQDGWSLKNGSSPNPKLAWIQQVIDSGPVGTGKLLKEYAGRQSLLSKSLGGRTLDLENRSAFVTGLGQAHPIESGFLWHPSLGVPYLSGSGVKGVLRSWLQMAGPEIATACNSTEECPVEATEIDRLLGSAGKVGAIDLLPMVPTGPVRLQADLVNPHHRPYQQGRDWPADWQEPIPSFSWLSPPDPCGSWRWFPGTTLRTVISIGRCIG